MKKYIECVDPDTLGISESDLSLRVEISPEIGLEILENVRQGNCEGLKKIFQSLNKAIPLEDMDTCEYEYYRYKLLIGCGRVSQIAITAGMPYEEATALSRKYFNEFHAMTDNRRIYDLSCEMFYEFARRVCFYRYPKYSRHVRQILDYIHKNAMNEILLDDIAAYTHLTPNYISALFKRETGRLLKKEIQASRIALAIQLLSDTSLSLSEIAKKTGFKQANHFSRVFRTHTGYSPKEYRNDKNRGNYFVEMYQQT